jgi:hypothetical protein
LHSLHCDIQIKCVDIDSRHPDPIEFEQICTNLIICWKLGFGIMNFQLVDDKKKPLFHLGRMITTNINNFYDKKIILKLLL